MSEPATAAAGLQFAPGVIHRASKRGLVIANRHGETVLFEHPRAAGIGCYLIVPLAIAVLVSLAGLIRQAVTAPSDG